VLRSVDPAADPSCGKRDVRVLGTPPRNVAGDVGACYWTICLTSRGAGNHASHTRHVPRSSKALRRPPELKHDGESRRISLLARGRSNESIPPAGFRSRRRAQAETL
jgi:hypothetical protein